MSTITPAHFLRTFHVLQVFLASYGGYNSYIAIRNLQEYEESVRKAAKWSNEAQHQLDRTRSTQAAGVVSVNEPVQHGNLARGIDIRADNAVDWSVFDTGICALLLTASGTISAFSSPTGRPGRGTAVHKIILGIYWWHENPSANDG